jgi:hypothetical protein
MTTMMTTNDDDEKRQRDADGIPREHHTSTCSPRPGYLPQSQQDLLKHKHHVYHSHHLHEPIVRRRREDRLLRFLSLRAKWREIQAAASAHPPAQKRLAARRHDASGKGGAVPRRRAQVQRPGNGPAGEVDQAQARLHRARQRDVIGLPDSGELRPTVSISPGWISVEVQSGCLTEEPLKTFEVKRRCTMDTWEPLYQS